MEVEYKIDKNNKVKIIVGKDPRKGTFVLASNNKGKFVDIFSYIHINSCFTDHLGHLWTDYFIQISSVDLDNDHKKELIITIGNTLTELVACVFEVTDSEITPFKYSGHIDGMSMIVLDENNHILIPYGSKGLFNEYTFSDGKLEMVQPKNHSKKENYIVTILEKNEIH